MNLAFHRAAKNQSAVLASELGWVVFLDMLVQISLFIEAQRTFITLDAETASRGDRGDMLLHFCICVERFLTFGAFGLVDRRLGMGCKSIPAFEIFHAEMALKDVRCRLVLLQCRCRLEYKFAHRTLEAMKSSIMLILALQSLECFVANTALEVVVDLVVTGQSVGSSEGYLASIAWKVVCEVVVVLQLALVFKGKIAISADPCWTVSSIATVVVDGFAGFKLLLARVAPVKHGITRFASLDGV